MKTYTVSQAPLLRRSPDGCCYGRTRNTRRRSAPMRAGVERTPVRGFVTLHCSMSLTDAMQICC